MSKFYGMVSGNATQSVTRRGSKFIQTSAQSWEGSIIVRLIDNKGKIFVEISKVDGSKSYVDSSAKCLYWGLLEKLGVNEG